MVRLTDRPDMTLDVYRGCKTTMQQQFLYKMFSLSKQSTMQQQFLYKMFSLSKQSKIISSCMKDLDNVVVLKGETIYRNILQIILYEGSR